MCPCVDVIPNSYSSGSSIEDGPIKHGASAGRDNPKGYAHIPLAHIQVTVLRFALFMQTMLPRGEGAFPRRVSCHIFPGLLPVDTYAGTDIHYSLSRFALVKWRRCDCVWAVLMMMAEGSDHANLVSPLPLDSL